MCCFRAGRCCQRFVLLILEYCFTVWHSASDTHPKPQDTVDSDACFLTGGVFECTIAYHRSVVILCMLQMIRCNCNLMHPLFAFNGALPGPHVPLQVTYSSLVAHRYTYAVMLPCTSSQYHRLLLPCQHLCGLTMMTRYSMVWGWPV